MLISRVGDNVRIQSGDDQVELTFPELELALEQLNNIHYEIADEKVREAHISGRLIDVSTLTQMQRIDPKTGEPIGPPIPLKRED